MKKPIVQVLVKRKFFITLLLFSIVCINPCWAQVVPPPTKAGCFSSGGAYKPCGSRWSDSYNGVSYNCFCDCSSWSAQDCVPVSGSTNTNSGQGSIPYQTNPGDISMYGPMNGNPFFSSHPSMSFEEWASEYKQLLASYGIASILGKNFTVPRTPLTDDKYFNAAYTNLAINFEPKTKPVSSNRTAPTPDAGVVDLNGKRGVVDPANLSGNANKTVPLLNSAVENRSLKASVVPLPVPGEMKEDTKHEYIDLTREHLVTLVAIAPGTLGYVSIAAVNIWAENAKAIKDIWDGNECPSTSTILVNALKQTAVDEAMQGLGTLGGSASGKLFASLADRSMIKKGVLPGIQGVVKEGKISEIGEAHYGLVGAGVDTGLKIMNAWGISTAFDAPK